MKPSLRGARKVACLSQNSLARLARVSKSRIALAESGEIFLRKSELDAISRILTQAIEKKYTEAVAFCAEAVAAYDPDAIRQTMATGKSPADQKYAADQIESVRKTLCEAGLSALVECLRPDPRLDSDDLAVRLAALQDDDAPTAELKSKATLLIHVEMIQDARRWYGQERDSAHEFHYLIEKLVALAMRGRTEVSKLPQVQICSESPDAR